MKRILIIPALFLTCLSYAHTCCRDDSAYRELRLPLTENDVNAPFIYFNEEWIFGVDCDRLCPDSISKMEVKDDEYGNKAIFITVSQTTLDSLKADVRKNWTWPVLEPTCEFPGGNGKLKEWLDANIRVPESLKGSQRVVVGFTVHPDGSITDAKILRPCKNDSANAEALRLVGELPPFRVRYYTPRKKPLHYMLPIIFRQPGTIYIR